MPITLLTGPANAGKARVVLDAVRRDLARGAEPLLIVPTREDVELYRRELAAPDVALGATVGRFDELLEEAVARAGTGGEVLGGLARERALEAIAAEGVSNAAARGYARELCALCDELRERRISGLRFRSAVESAGLGRHAQRAAEAVEEYDALLARIRRTDPHARALKALDALRRSPWLWGTRPVHLYGFDDLTRLQLDVVLTLGTVVDVDVTVSLAFEAGRTAFASRAAAVFELEPLAREQRTLAPRSDYYEHRARSALSHAERALFEPSASRAHECEGVRLAQASDEREELEIVAQEIGCLLRAGVPPAEIAVALRSPEVAADLLEDVFERAGIPFAFERDCRFADTAAGSSLIGLLRSVDGAGGATRDLLAWLRTPGLLERPELADRLEARARRDGILRAEDARELWEREHWPLDAVRRLQDAQARPLKLISRALSQLERAFAAAWAGSAHVLADDELDEARALSAGRRALEELRELARLAPELAPQDARSLADALEDVRFRGGPHAPRRGTASRDSIIVTHPLALRARRVRALFLCRLQAGSFPLLERRAPLLGEDERRRLAQLAGLRLSDARDAFAEERYLFYAAVSRPEQSLVLSWHTTAEDGSSRSRSQFIDEVCALFEGAPATLEAPPALFASVRAARTATPVETRTAAHLEAPTAAPAPVETGARRPGDSLENPAAVAGAVAAAGAAAAAAADAAAARISGTDLVPDGEQTVWSASSLGLWMSCPVRWFVERVLRAEDLDPRAEPLARGLLAHAVLRDTFEALGLETGSARITRASVGRARAHLANAVSARASELPLSAERERAPALLRRLRADLEHYLEHAADAAEDADAAGDGSSVLEPRHLELEFGLGENALPALDLGEGLKLRGRIDRVDVNARGEAVVYDYKGRSATPAAKWLEDGEVQVALYMRAVEELLGVRAAGGLYQPLGRELRARGVLDADSAVALRVVSSDRREHSEVRELVEQAVTAARVAAGQAKRGELEPRPQTCSPRGGCAYPAICRCAC